MQYLHAHLWWMISSCGPPGIPARCYSWSFLLLWVFSSYSSSTDPTCVNQQYSSVCWSSPCTLNPHPPNRASSGYHVMKMLHWLHWRHTSLFVNCNLPHLCFLERNVALMTLVLKSMHLQRSCLNALLHFLPSIWCLHSFLVVTSLTPRLRL